MADQRGIKSIYEVFVDREVGRKFDRKSWRKSWQKKMKKMLALLLILCYIRKAEKDTSVDSEGGARKEPVPEEA